MSRNDSNAPVIIRRKRVIVAVHQQHGAWKVAYADFVTAMMAFFLMMWLLSLASPEQRQKLADYFNPALNPTLVTQTSSAGSDGMLQGNESDSDSEVVRNEQPMPAAERAETEALREIESSLTAIGSESPEMAMLMRHVTTRITDEGLVVELFDLAEEPLFHPESAAPRPVLEALGRVIARNFMKVDNPVALQTHVRSYPITLREDPTWDLAARRVEAGRRLVERAGLPASRLQRLTGFGDRRPASRDPMMARNNRIEFILLRQGPDSMPVVTRS